MNTFTQKHLWKILIALVAVIGMTSCESMDQGRAKWESMSKKDQSTIIGGVGGAVLGSVVTGKKATGAILGGVAGAVGGRVWSEKKHGSNVDQPMDDGTSVY